MKVKEYLNVMEQLSTKENFMKQMQMVVWKLC